MALITPGENLVLSQIVEGNPVATIVIDHRHRVTHWNRACAMLTGVPASEMIGTTAQWRAFYDQPRPIMADIIVDGATVAAVDEFYHGKFRHSPLIEGAFEAEDFFPAFGEGGSWLYFTAAPLRDASGRVIGAIETLQDVTRRRKSEDALRESEERYRLLSVTDSLTGLFNRRHLHQCLKSELERVHRYGRALSLLVLDCDDFKQINDTRGHIEGDRVLQLLAKLISDSLRRSDCAFRYGGEEFVILLPEADAEAACILAERLRETFAGQRIQAHDGELFHCTVSVGVAEYAPGESENTFIHRADDATYEAKRRGKNCVVLSS